MPDKPKEASAEVLAAQVQDIPVEEVKDPDEIDRQRLLEDPGIAKIAKLIKMRVPM